MTSWSIIVATRNRPALAHAAIESIDAAADRIDGPVEIVVVDDSDDLPPPEHWQSATSRPVTIIDGPGRGVSVARNLAIQAATGDRLFLFDDDDEATPGLLVAHENAAQHAMGRGRGRSASSPVAVLGRTDWHPRLTVTPAMHHVIHRGGNLFGYSRLAPGRDLSFQAFWSGRISLERRVLMQHGLFDPRLAWGHEDVELGYRLQRRGLRIQYHPDALQYMARPLTLDDLLRRAHRQGQAARRLGLDLYPGHGVMASHCHLPGAARRWRVAARTLEQVAARVWRHEATGLDAAATPDKVFHDYGVLLAAVQDGGRAGVAWRELPLGRPRQIA